MKLNGRLELTWTGKEDRHHIERRLLIEDKTKSYGDPNSENMLIHGDNLLALKALEKNIQEKLSVFLLIHHIILDLLSIIMMIIWNIVYG